MTDLTKATKITLQPDDVPEHTEQDKHVLLTLQPRIPAGSLSMAELPAGMLDDSGSFSGAAAKEIEEECGLTIPADQLIDMTSLALSISISSSGSTTTTNSNDDDKEAESDSEHLQKAVYTSPGGQDEFIAIFLHQKRIPRKQLDEFTGKLTGLRDHGEKITLKCVRLEELWKEGARDAKTLAAWALYEGLRRESKL